MTARPQLLSTQLDQVGAGASGVGPPAWLPTIETLAGLTLPKKSDIHTCEDGWYACTYTNLHTHHTPRANSHT